MNYLLRLGKRHLVAALGMTLVVAACGGGGGSGTSAPRDTTPPTATVAVDRSTGLIGDVVVLTITASEALSGLDPGDLTVVNGSVLPIQTNGVSLYQVPIRLGADGPHCQITLPPGVCTDRAGNPLAATWTGTVEIAEVGHAWAYGPLETNDQGKSCANLRVNGQTLRFVWIAPGTFLQGSPRSEIGRYSDERQHAVILTRGFWMSESEVPNTFWLAAAPGYPAGVAIASTAEPISGLSVADIDGFLSRLTTAATTATSHPTIRLPSEAEWEYAARAGTTTPFSCASPPTTALVNCLPSDDDVYVLQTGTANTYLDHKVAVKALPANPWGLYEMHGNVWEVCADWYTAAYPAGPVVDPFGAEDGSSGRSVRGGGYNSLGRMVRSANRVFAPDVTGRDFFKIGLRLVIAGEAYVPAGGG